MSWENLEIVRRMYDAYVTGDFEESLTCLDSEIEFSTPAEEPGGGTYQGHRGVIEAMTKWTGAWEEYRVEVEDLVDLDDHVLAAIRQRGRGRGSGVEVENQVFQLWTLRNGKVVQARMYYDQAEALEAVGLRE
jgi:uncharacterized protein